MSFPKYPFVSLVSSPRNSRLRAPSLLRNPFLCMALIALIAPSARSQNWDRFRGPNGAGQSDDASIPSTWSDANFLWKQPLPGVGHSSPVVWGDTLFLTYADAASGAQTIAAFDARRGTPRWQKQFAASTYHIHGLNSLASSTPAVDAEHVYVMWLQDGAVMLAALTHGGDEVWRRDIGPFKEVHGFGISPVVVDQLVYVSRDSGAESGIAAFDRTTGKPSWTLPFEPGTTSFSTPCVLDDRASPKLLLTCNTTCGLTAIDASTGKIAWQAAQEELDQRCVASPIVARGKVFVGCGQGGKGKLLLAIAPGTENSSPREVYRLSQNVPQVPTPIVAGELLIAWSDKGIVSCYDVATGKQHWRERIGGDFHSSPIRIGDRVFGFSRRGEAIVIAADKEYQLVARNSLDEPVVATPAVAHNRLYVRTPSTLFCIGDPEVARSNAP